MFKISRGRCQFGRVAGHLILLIWRRRAARVGDGHFGDLDLSLRFGRLKQQQSHGSACQKARIACTAGRVVMPRVGQLACCTSRRTSSLTDPLPDPSDYISSTSIRDDIPEGVNVRSPFTLGS